VVPWREPYELRGSSTVLREARGEIPRAYSPGAAGADGTTGAGGVGATAESVRRSSIVVEPVGEPVDGAGGGFRGFAFRKAPGRMLLMWPREKARRNIRQPVREAVRSCPSNGQVVAAIRRRNPILNGWCTCFRVGNSNRTFHGVDGAVRSEPQFWLRRKHRCPWRTAKKRWGYRFLHDRCRLYQMAGKVRHPDGLRYTPPDEDDRRAGCGKTARPVRCGGAGNLRERGARALLCATSATGPDRSSQIRQLSCDPAPSGVCPARFSTAAQITFRVTTAVSAISCGYVAMVVLSRSNGRM
jgi:hypothetical protein